MASRLRARKAALPGEERGGARNEPVHRDSDLLGTCGQCKQLDSLACGRGDLKAGAGEELHAETERQCSKVSRGMKLSGGGARLSVQWVGLPFQNK